MKESNASSREIHSLCFDGKSRMKFQDIKAIDDGLCWALTHASTWPSNVIVDCATRMLDTGNAGFTADLMKNRPESLYITAFYEYKDSKIKQGSSQRLSKAANRNP